MDNEIHSAKLIWITNEAERLIGKIARVSNPKNEDNPSVEGLLKYLIKHKHWSPFEMASMCLEITTTRAIAAQILRHRSFSFQEFSQRYAVAGNVAEQELRRQDTTNRQNSFPDLDPDIFNLYRQRIKANADDALDLYHEMLELGIAKECARAVLPLNVKTRMYMSGTVRSWLHYIDLRSSHGTQAEHRLIALSALDIITREMPTISKSMWPNDQETKT